MQIVIDIPEKTYIHLHDGGSIGASLMIENAIKRGTPLPKGHGRLKDENEIKQMIEDTKVKNETSKIFAENIVRCASTIIEADKAESEVADI